MMGQLMGKDVLYDPLKELNDKARVIQSNAACDFEMFHISLTMQPQFPAYMKENASKLKDEDKRRYDGQIATIAKILAVFDDPKYKDEDPEKGAEIVALMSEVCVHALRVLLSSLRLPPQMQAHGSPPEELMGPLPPGMNMGSDGMPNVTDDCKMQ
jgi:peroxin-19